MVDEDRNKPFDEDNGCYPPPIDVPDKFKSYNWRMDLYNLGRAGDPHASDRLTDYIEKLDGRCQEAYAAGCTNGEYHAVTEYEGMAFILADKCAGLDRFHDTVESNLRWAREQARRNRDANRRQ